MVNKFWHVRFIVFYLLQISFLSSLTMAGSHNVGNRSEVSHPSTGLRLKRLANTELVWKELKGLPEIKFIRGTLDQKTDETVQSDAFPEYGIVVDIHEVAVKENRKYCITLNDLSPLFPTRLGLGLVIESSSTAGPGSRHAINENMMSNLETQHLCFVPTGSGTIRLKVIGATSRVGKGLYPYSLLVHEGRE